MAYPDGIVNNGMQQQLVLLQTYSHLHPFEPRVGLARKDSPPQLKTTRGVLPREPDWIRAAMGQDIGDVGNAANRAIM
jgi:hypothetical protein